jgi:hypothetical protein
MQAKIYPPNPIFKNHGERKVFETLVPLLTDDDAIIANLEMSDPEAGDIEIDLVLLLKDYGCMVIEVKGAHITYDHGSWIQSDPSGSHEIDPAGQAKRNMYSLRNYLTSRWSQGILRCDWMVAFPHCSGSVASNSKSHSERRIALQHAPNSNSFKHTTKSLTASLRWLG